MSPTNTARRNFMLQLTGVAGVTWLTAHWPSIAFASQHAHQAVNSKVPVKFEVLTADQAQEVAAIAARIIPTDHEPGATEAGVVYFIDRALKTFASDNRLDYETGLIQTNKLASKMFPGVTRFSSATEEQQDQVLTEMSKGEKFADRLTRQTRHGIEEAFIVIIWEHTLLGFLVDTEDEGNPDPVGWKVIGRDPAHTFSSPFGFYDQNYPGWQAENAAEAGKK